MYRNNGINYKYPRSTGGKFYQQKIDEGRSRLFQFFGNIIPEPAQSDIIFSWNENDVSQFGTGFWVNGNGAGTGSVIVSKATSSFAITYPGVKFELQRLVFSASSPNPTGLYIIPVNTGPLPRRFSVRYNITEAALAAQQAFSVGHVLGATTASANSANMYGTAWLFNSASTGGYDIRTIQSGSASIGYASNTSIPVHLDGGGAGTISIYYNFEMPSTVGTVSGSAWRLEDEASREDDDANKTYKDVINSAMFSAAYGDWSAISAPLDSFYFAFTSFTASASPRSIIIENFAILKHPLDRTNGSISTL
jgi:hypothetical protein